MAYIVNTDPIWKELASIASDEGLSLYDLERFGATGLRVYIAGPDSSKGVTSGDCSKTCRRLMTYFTVEGPSLGVGAEPEIEVSSPGINRHLRLWDHFTGAVGERVRISVRGEAFAEDTVADAVSNSEGSETENGTKIGGVLGTLEAAQDETLLVRDEKTNRSWKFGFDQVAKANIEFSFGGPQKKIGEKGAKEKQKDERTDREGLAANEGA